jgi:Rad3-related DNA helicase
MSDQLMEALRQIEWWAEQYRQQTARIEALEAALREIANLRYSNTSAASIAQAALAPERRHTTPEATDRKDWPKDGFINDYD